MADKLTLKLQADVFHQPKEDKADAETTLRSKGDVFQARNQAEYDRLVNSGAAIDPEKAAEEEQARLQERREQLEAEKAQLDEQLKSVRADEKSAKSG